MEGAAGLTGSQRIDRILEGRVTKHLNTQIPKYPKKRRRDRMGPLAARKRLQGEVGRGSVDDSGRPAFALRLLRRGMRERITRGEIRKERRDDYPTSRFAL